MMGKHIAFSIILNILIFASLLVGYYFFKLENYLIPIVCLASFSLSVYYKLKHLKIVRAEMQQKAEQIVKSKNNK
jgi:hypothetical protein